MYRKRNGSLSFSFGRLMLNAFPNIANDNAAREADIALPYQDLLYAYQLAQPNPMILDKFSFRVAGVVSTEKHSQKVHRALQANGVLGGADGGTIQTSNIGPKFTHQLSFISVGPQRKVVGMLFLWEEEVQRMRKLDGEEQELTGLISQAESGTDEGSQRSTLDQLKLARERVRMKKRQKPSERSEDIETDCDNILARSFLVPQQGAQRPDDMPPAYA